MADKAISDLNSTTTTSGGYVEISIPDGGGGWLSKRITHSNFLAAVNATLTTLAASDAAGTQKTRHAAEAASFTQILGSDVFLENITIIWVAGTPSVKVGTSALASDVVPTQTPLSGTPSSNTINKYFEAATTLYFTVTGGTVDVIVNNKENYNT